MSITSERIKERRQHLEMSQEELALLSGYSTKTSICHIENPEKHNTNDLYVHSVNVMNDTMFSKIIGKDVIKVNSRHKKTVATHPNLIVNCICEDGYIDGLESPDKTFYMAFRFHPESLYKVDKNHNKIFEEFIKVCSIKE